MTHAPACIHIHIHLISDPCKVSAAAAADTTSINCSSSASNRRGSTVKIARAVLAATAAPTAAAAAPTTGICGVRCSHHRIKAAAAATAVVVVVVVVVVGVVVVVVVAVVVGVLTTTTATTNATTTSTTTIAARLALRQVMCRLPCAPVRGSTSKHEQALEASRDDAPAVSEGAGEGAASDKSGGGSDLGLVPCEWPLAGRTRAAGEIGEGGTPPKGQGDIFCRRCCTSSS